jgi:hypothetical protein
MHRRPLVIALVALTACASIAHADGIDLSAARSAQTRRSVKAKEIAGGVALALGIPAMISGAVFLGAGALQGFGCLDGCTPAEERAVNAKSVGGGVAMGIGLGATVIGAITLSVAAQQRKAMRRELSISVAPTASGAAGVARVSF